MQFKEKQSVKVDYHFTSPYSDDRSLTFKGIIYKITDADVVLIDVNSSRNRDSYRNYSEHIVSISRKYITNISSTRLPKEISSKLLDLWKQIREAEKMQEDIREMERQLQSKRVFIKDLEKDILDVRLHIQPTLVDLATKLGQDLKGLSFHHRNGEDEMSIDNVNVHDGRLLVQLSFSRSTRNVRGVSFYGNHMDNCDLNDWESIAKNNTPNFENIVRKHFNFASEIKSSQNASPGEKSYVYLSNDYMIYLNLTKSNYDETLAKMKNAVSQVKTMTML